MYKVGDEVWVKGKVIATEDKSADVKIDGWGASCWFAEKELLSTDKTYSDGLSDAWELAKKLESMPLEELKKVFGVCGFYSVVKQYKIEEALAKIEAYESAKEIEVGDEVRYGNGEDRSRYAVVMKIEGNEFYTMFADGSCGRETHTECFKKTGKHIDIESLLKQIGE